MNTRWGYLWRSEGGVREVLIVAIPLILSCGAHTIQTFIDRLFLARLDNDAMSGAMLAGLCNFCFVAFLMGLVAYTSTFVAQYGGAGRPERIGPAVWQGIYLALAGGTLGLLLVFIAEPLFGFIGHSSRVQAYEVSYFKVMSFCVMPVLLSTAFSCFYSGRGRTDVVMWINVSVCGINILFDYLLIFGHWGFPKLGVTGAALATVIAMYSAVLVYAVMFFRKKYDEMFHTRRGRRPQADLMGRLLRFGMPNGVNFMLDMINFTAFLAIIGRYDELVQAAVSMVFSVNMIAFMPVVGIGMAVSIVVGKYLGMDRPANAVKSAWIALAIGVLFMTFISLIYVFFGKLLLRPFIDSAPGENAGKLMSISQKMLYFVAIYSIADAVVIVLSSVLKGAGDTRFVMNVSFACGLLLMVVPTWLSVRLGLSYYVPWIMITAFVFALTIFFSLRFKGGKWKDMRVIERPSLPE
jgi:multidrug resistance protein, MATE family